MQVSEKMVKSVLLKVVNVGSIPDITVQACEMPSRGVCLVLMTPALVVVRICKAKPGVGSPTAPPLP